MQFHDLIISEILCGIISVHRTVLKGDYTVLTEHENINIMENLEWVSENVKNVIYWPWKRQRN